MSDPDLTVGSVLTDDLRAWLVADLRYPVLAINSHDGPPSQSVMWFELDPDDRDAILMNTKVERMKYRQLQADPRVSLLFEDGESWVAMRGTVELDATLEPALEHYQVAGAPISGQPPAVRRPAAGHPPGAGRQGHPARLTAAPIAHAEASRVAESSHLTQEHQAALRRAFTFSRCLRLVAAHEASKGVHDDHVCAARHARSDGRSGADHQA